MTTAELREKLEPYFTSTFEVCVLCRHHKSSHYWNGAGNPDQSGYDSCKLESCKCEGKFEPNGYLVTDIDHTTDIEALTAQMQTFATFLEEIALPAKHDAPINKLFEANDSGFNQAVNDCRQVITQAANELKGQDNG